MQARVSNIQGTCTIKSTKNEGTQIFVSIPVKGHTLAEY
jgi:signal transduction histidine kinase